MIRLYLGLVVPVIFFHAIIVLIYEFLTYNMLREIINISLKKSSIFQYFLHTFFNNNDNNIYYNQVIKYDAHNHVRE